MRFSVNTVSAEGHPAMCTHLLPSRLCSSRCLISAFSCTTHIARHEIACNALPSAFVRVCVSTLHLIRHQCHAISRLFKSQYLHPRLFRLGYSFLMVEQTFSPSSTALRSSLFPPGLSSRASVCFFLPEAAVSLLSEKIEGSRISHASI